MRQTRRQMGMLTTVEVAEPCHKEDLQEIFDYFDHVDQVFSPYRSSSEVVRFGRGEIGPNEVSPELAEVLSLSEQTKQQTGGYFDVWHKGRFDPSGLVKGWAIHQAAARLRERGFKNFYIEAGGDIEVSGKNQAGQDWRIGIRHPWQKGKLAQVVILSNAGIATSGTYLLGQHIYNPFQPGPIKDTLSLTVIAKDAYEADRIATAAFAMGRRGLEFIATQRGVEGYMILKDQTTEMTGGFAKCLTSST